MRRLTPSSARPLRTAGIFPLIAVPWRRSRVEIRLDKPDNGANHGRHSHRAVARSQSPQDQRSHELCEQERQQRGEHAGRERHLVRLQRGEVEDTAAARLVLRHHKNVVLRGCEARGAGRSVAGGAWGRHRLVSVCVEGESERGAGSCVCR